MITKCHSKETVEWTPNRDFKRPELERLYKKAKIKRMWLDTYDKKILLDTTPECDTEND